MQQDWSAPFTIDLIKSVQSFCVYCETQEDDDRFRDFLNDANIPCNLEFEHSRYPCYRFERGRLAKHDTVDTYESELFAYLPKYTFVPGYNTITLPDLNISDACDLFC